MTNIRKLLLIGACFLQLIPFVGSAAGSEYLNEVIDKIKSAEKVEQLYNIKYNLDKELDNTELTIENLRIIIRAHYLLSAAFESHNHFRNAVDVHSDYIKLIKRYHENYTSFISDSIQQSNQAESKAIASRINALDTETTVLKSKQEVISGLRSNYFLFGGIGVAVILIIGITIFIKRTKAIEEAKRNTENLRQKILAVHKLVIESAIADGSIAYAKFTATENIELIEEIELYYQSNSDVSAFADSLKAIKEAKKKFSEVQVF